mgnify:CR=1 FL=1
MLTQIRSIYAPAEPLIFGKPIAKEIFWIGLLFFITGLFPSKQIAVKIKEAIPCTKVGVAVIGLEVPHAHIHLVPMQKEGDLDFKRPKLQLSQEEFVEIQNKLAF